MVPISSINILSYDWVKELNDRSRVWLFSNWYGFFYSTFPLAEKFMALLVQGNFQCYYLDNSFTSNASIFLITFCQILNFQDWLSNCLNFYLLLSVCLCFTFWNLYHPAPLINSCIHVIIYITSRHFLVLVCPQPSFASMWFCFSRSSISISWGLWSFLLFFFYSLYHSLQHPFIQ